MREWRGSGVVRHSIIDSGSGDLLGYIAFSDDDADELVTEQLTRGGYLEGDPDEYRLDRAYHFSHEGAVTVLDQDDQPVLELEPEEGDDPDDDDDDDDEEDDGDDEDYDDEEDDDE